MALRPQASAHEGSSAAAAAGSCAAAKVAAAANRMAEVFMISVGRLYFV